MDSLSFTAALDGIPTSRRWVVAWARRAGCPEACVSTLALLTTEAVTNAVRHGPDGGTVTVTVSQVRGQWRVAVTDQSRGRPVVRDVEPWALGGRGVMLIDRLAAAWGVDGGRGGAKTVWFHVTCGD